MDANDMDEAISVTMPGPLKAEVEKRQTKGNAKWMREAARARIRDEDNGTWVPPDGETPKAAVPDGGEDTE